jgi:hypothetical protein
MSVMLSVEIKLIYAQCRFATSWGLLGDSHAIRIAKYISVCVYLNN